MSCGSCSPGSHSTCVLVPSSSPVSWGQVPAQQSGQALTLLLLLMAVPAHGSSQSRVFCRAGFGGAQPLGSDAEEGSAPTVPRDPSPKHSDNCPSLEQCQAPVASSCLCFSGLGWKNQLLCLEGLSAPLAGPSRCPRPSLLGESLSSLPVSGAHIPRCLVLAKAQLGSPKCTSITRPLALAPDAPIIAQHGQYLPTPPQCPVPLPEWHIRLFLP